MDFIKLERFLAKNLKQNSELEQSIIYKLFYIYQDILSGAYNSIKIFICVIDSKLFAMLVI